MKQLKHLFTALLLLCVTTATAQDFVLDGIYYNIDSAVDKTVEVCKKPNSGYVGSVVIPERVTYNNIR